MSQVLPKFDGYEIKMDDNVFRSNKLGLKNKASHFFCPDHGINDENGHNLGGSSKEPNKKRSRVDDDAGTDKESSLI